jgi:hypothetical protein
MGQTNAVLQNNIAGIVPAPYNFHLTKFYFILFYFILYTVCILFSRVTMGGGGGGERNYISVSEKKLMCVPVREFYP